MRPSKTRFLVVTFGLHLVLFTTLPCHADGKHVVASSLSYGSAPDGGIPEEGFQSSHNAWRPEKQSGSSDGVTETVIGTVVAAVENRSISLHEETFSTVNEIITFFKGVLQKPKPLSLLMNFGLDGVSRWETANTNIPDLQDECPSGFVYDPFGFVCRPTVCVPIKDLAGNNLTCRTEGGHLMREAINIPPNATSVGIQILLALENATADLDRLLTWQGPIEHHTETVLRLELETRLKPLRVHPSQIGTVSVPTLFRHDCAGVVIRNSDGKPSDPSHIFGRERNRTCLTSKDIDWEHLIQVPVAVALTRPPERRNTSDSLVEVFAHLANEILSGEFTFEVDGFKVVAEGIEVESENGTRDFITEQAWCTPGVVTTYINEEFTVNDYYGNLTDIEMFVNETGMTYQAADFRFQVLLRMEGMHATMSQIALTCQRPLKCPNSGAFVADGAIILQNHSLWYNNRTYNRWEYYPNPRTTSIEICGVPKLPAAQPQDLLLGFEMGHVFGDLSVVFISISLNCLVFTLIIYAIFEDLRTLPGWNLINIMVAMVVGQTALLHNNVVGERNFCHAIGIITHYAFLVQFFSANVIAWDIFSKFGRTGLGSLTHGRNQPIAKRVLKNMAYSYLFSAVFVAVAVVLDILNLQDWAVGYADLCWIAGKRVSAICFALPLLLITIVNTVLFFITLKRMRAYKKSVKGLFVSAKKQNRLKNEALTHVRMMSVLGLMWIFGIVAGFTRGLVKKDSSFILVYEVLISVFLLAESSQGFFIFLGFGINPMVRKRIRNLYSRFQLKGCEKCKKRFCSCGVTPAGSRSSAQLKIPVTTARTTKIQESLLEATNQNCVLSTPTSDYAESADCRLPVRNAKVDHILQEGNQPDRTAQLTQGSSSSTVFQLTNSILV